MLCNQNDMICNQNDGKDMTIARSFAQLQCIANGDDTMKYVAFKELLAVCNSMIIIECFSTKHSFKPFQASDDS